MLGPFIGKPACVRIAFGQGVCGAAAARALPQIVQDVHAFPGHIACDVGSQSELVVPIQRPGVVTAAIDLDSSDPAHFDKEDAAGIEMLGRTIASTI